MGITSYIKLNVRTAPFFFLTFLGVLFYMVWGAAYGGWTDIGVYSITIILLGFGIVGMFLYSLEEEEE
jgi:hypothetical protein